MEPENQNQDNGGNSGGGGRPRRRERRRRDDADRVNLHMPATTAEAFINAFRPQPAPAAEAPTAAPAAPAEAPAPAEPRVQIEAEHEGEDGNDFAFDIRMRGRRHFDAVDEEGAVNMFASALQQEAPDLRKREQDENGNGWTHDWRNWVMIIGGLALLVLILLLLGAQNGAPTADTGTQQPVIQPAPPPQQTAQVGQVQIGRLAAFDTSVPTAWPVVDSNQLTTQFQRGEIVAVVYRNVATATQPADLVCVLTNGRDQAISPAPTTSDPLAYRNCRWQNVLVGTFDIYLTANGQEVAGSRRQITVS